MTGPPSIVLVVFDQLRADALGAGHTPFLDAFAATAVSFAACLTNAPLCRPARFTLLTGSPVHAHRVASNQRPPPLAGLPSHVRRLRDEAGYHTHVVGKTHLHGGHGHLDAHRDLLAAAGWQGALELPDAQQHWVGSAYTDALTAGTPAGAVDKAARWADHVRRSTWETPPPEVAPCGLGEEDHLDVFCAAQAAAFARGWGGDRPLYLTVSFPGPHPPLDASGARIAAVDPASLRTAILGPGSGPDTPMGTRYARRQEVPPHAWTPARAAALRRRYAAKVGLVDACFGRVLDALAHVGLDRAAWIVVTADHGELAGDHHLTGKVLPYDGAVRVPLLIRPPGGVSGWVDRGLVDHLDLVATLLDVAGLPAQGMGRSSLAARVRGGPGGPLAHRDDPVAFGCLGYAAIRTATHTLAWHLDHGRPVALYDRATDPEERHNRVDDPAAAAAVDALVDQLRLAWPL